MYLLRSFKSITNFESVDLLRLLELLDAVGSLSLLSGNPLPPSASLLLLGAMVVSAPVPPNAIVTLHTVEPGVRLPSLMLHLSSMAAVPPSDRLDTVGDGVTGNSQSSNDDLFESHRTHCATSRLPSIDKLVFNRLAFRCGAFFMLLARFCPRPHAHIAAVSVRVWLLPQHCLWLLWLDTLSGNWNDGAHAMFGEWRPSDTSLLACDEPQWPPSLSCASLHMHCNCKSPKLNSLRPPVEIVSGGACRSICSPSIRLSQSSVIEIRVHAVPFGWWALSRPAPIAVIIVLVFVLLSAHSTTATGAIVVLLLFMMAASFLPPPLVVGGGFSDRQLVAGLQLSNNDDSVVCALPRIGTRSRKCCSWLHSARISSSASCSVKRPSAKMKNEKKKLKLKDVLLCVTKGCPAAGHMCVHWSQTNFATDEMQSNKLRRRKWRRTISIRGIMIVANRNTLSRLKSVGLSRLFLCGPPVGCRLYLSFRYILAAAAAMTTTTSPTTNSNGLRREKWQNCIYPAFNGHSLFRSQPPNIRQRQCWPSSSTHIQHT